jgi:iron complex outermembrane recepter protein
MSKSCSLESAIRIILTAGLAEFSLCAASLGATAANAPDPQGTEESGAIQEIVVTATRREENISKVPISITALSGPQLEERGITSVASLVGEVPGVSMKSNGPGQTEFEMRGLSSSGGSSPTVGFYLDDTPLTAPAAAVNGKVVIDPSLYDLNRIEVLRGPQGTLYGSGSMGGTIRLITNQPDAGQFAASAQSSLSGTDGGGFNHAENVMLNIPLIDDVLALRAIATESHTSGWLSRIAVNDFPAVPNYGTVRGDVLAAPVAADYRGVNDTDLTGGRISLSYKPNDRLTITPMVFLQNIEQGGANSFDSVPGALAHYQPFNVAEPFSDKFLLGNIAVNYKFDAFSVTSVTSDWTRTEQITQDQAENLQWAFDLPSVYPSQGGLGGGAMIETDATKQFSEEIRLTSSGTANFQWLIGGFYSRFTSDWNLSSQVPNGIALFGTNNQFTQYQPTTISQKAAFGEASYQLLPTLKATVGLRRYSYDASLYTVYSGFGSATGSNASASNSGTQSSQGVNPKFNLSLQATDDLLLYTTVAKGFRPGGPNQPIPNNPQTTLGASCLASLEALGKTAAPEFYKSDGVWSYEVGEKANLDGRVTVNSAFYYESWKGVQQVVALSCGYPYTDNTGDAAVYGSELEVDAVLIKGLVASANVGYTNARLTQNDPDTGGHKGDELQAIAPWTAGAALAETFPIGNGLDADARLSYDYVGPRIDATYYPKNHLPGYGLVNLRAGVKTRTWSTTLFVDNLTNTTALLSDTQALSVNLPTYNRVATNQPRTAGIDLSYRFK